MLRSMYSGISGMRGFQTKLDVIGNNISNVNTVGFKKGRVMFQDILSQTVAGETAPTSTTQGGINSKQIGLGVGTAAIDTVHTGGSAMTTNVPTDLRIDGNGFFGVTQNGQDPLYLTRAGNFYVDGDNYIVNPDGMYLMSTDSEPIQLDANATKFSISQDGTVMQVIGGVPTPSDYKVAVVKVANPAGLNKAGGNLYEYTPNADVNNTIDVAYLSNALPADPVTGTGSIIAGQLEMSNVDLTEEFSEMIVSQRGFQANSRIITTSDEILQEIVNLKR
ncbi:flagellar basal body rod protein FlgG [Paenibacillus chitinolyticus]|uniref:Flagellar hook protein FlgE n=1 Tax=Paenibacillus chitinolyticus TaxID=79263 RepID=A0A410X0W1_9BACL|nr:flagellar basal body rod protein FlgG [Paenibacillus chitinolyticus]MCY9593685.1 flagellar hook-basal body complex protein [Paenibacillus chitinolyticus]MCY9599749.1 flagellar hook-basal body complex protein [Paenibacillus chitinolyticus]QAV20082.1 flagellar basal body rod protein FlgG [Paenibacillus chitinolyticus]